MSGLAAIAWRELVERRVVLAAAVVAAVLPLVAPLLPGASGNGSDVRDVTAWAVAALVTVCFGLLLGGSVLASDLADARLGFYLARPVSALAVWAGKMGAAAVLTMASAAVILMIPLLLGLQSLPLGPTSIGLGWSMLAFAGLAGLMISGAHAATVMWRVRSAWLVLDLTGATAVGAGAWWALHRLRKVGADDLVFGLGTSMGVWLLLALLAAGALATARGRVEQLRTHRVLSLTLWGLLGLGVVSAAGYVQWLSTPMPSDLVSPYPAVSAPTGTWVAVGSAVRRRGENMRAAFLLDTSSGHFLRLPAKPWGLPAMAFAPDGSAAVWAQPSGRRQDDPVELVFADLTSPVPRTESTGLVVHTDPYAPLALDAGGARLALVADGTLAVHRLPAGELEAAVPLDETWRSDRLALVWPKPGVLRVYAWPHPWRDTVAGHVLRIGELRLPARRLVETGRTVLGSGAYPLQLDVAGERLLMRERPGEGDRVTVRVLDARTGEVRARPGAARVSYPGIGVLLAGGGLATGRVEQGAAVLGVHRPDGRSYEISLGKASGLHLGGEPEPGLLLIAFAPPASFDPRRSTAIAVELTTGRQSPVGKGVVPAINAWGRLHRLPVPGSPATRLLLSEDALEVWDPATGERRVIAGRAGRP